MTKNTIFIYIYLPNLSMRKYSALKIIFESREGATPREVSEKLQTALPNVYKYLKELTSEKLVQRGRDGKYRVNRTTEKLRQLMNLQSMAPDTFHTIISPKFRGALEKLCKRITTKRKEFSPVEEKLIKKIAIPKRIVLRVSGKPLEYTLKLNEALVAELLKYHDLDSSSSQADFQKFISGLNITQVGETVKGGESDPKIIEVCNDAYSKGGDLFISKVPGFAPDARILDMIAVAEQANREYILFLNALEGNVRDAIKEQWEQRYVYNTNSIEGNTMTEKNVKDYLKGGLAPGNASKREIHETNNMKQALGFMKLKENEEISEELVKELHFIIQTNIDENRGEYKRFYNHVDNNPTTPPKHVPGRMKELMGWYGQNRRKLHPFVLASAFHIQFEMIHPFQDGNGRVGRLLMNHILKKNGYMPLTIMEKTKQNYYRAIGNQSLPQFLFYALMGFIEEYKR